MKHKGLPVHPRRTQVLYLLLQLAQPDVYLYLIASFTGFRSDIKTKIKGDSLQLHQRYLRTQGARIGQHGLVNHQGYCMDFHILEEMPIGRDYRVTNVYKWSQKYQATFTVVAGLK